MFSFFREKQVLNSLLTSRLFDETSFYGQFIKDLSQCKEEIIIESPYITSLRSRKLIPIFEKLLKKGVKINLITRDPSEHDEYFKYQATNEILECIELGINVVLLKRNHHRKLAILDRTILWEGSLNILSQNFSREFMRRTENKLISKETFNFLGLNRII